jgi:hypothetical protein
MFDSMGGTKAELSDIRDSTPAVLCGRRNRRDVKPAAIHRRGDGHSPACATNAVDKFAGGRRVLRPSR